MQKIFKGDTSAQIALTLSDGFDYTGATVEVAYQDVVRRFTNVTAGQTVNVTFSAAETATMALGAFPVCVRILKGATVLTVTNAGVKVAVTDCVGELRAGSTIVIDVNEGLYGVDGLSDSYTLKEIKAKVNEIIARLGGTVAALVLAASCALADNAVYTATLEDLPNDAQVVTNVTFGGSSGGGGVSTNAVDALISSFNATNETLAAWVGGGAWTNAVAGVVTNEVAAGFSAWTCPSRIESEFGQYSCDLGFLSMTQSYDAEHEWWNLNATYTGVVNGVWNDSVNFFTQPAKDETSISAYNSAWIECRFTRSRTYANALGLAYARDVPTTNGLASAARVAAVETSVTETAAAIAPTALGVFESNADYVLTNLTGAAVTLASGTIGSLALDANTTNIYLTLTFNAQTNRSADVLLVIANAAESHLAISNDGTDVLGSEWATLKAGTNMVMATKVANFDGRSVVSVSTKEVK